MDRETRGDAACPERPCGTLPPATSSSQPTSAGAAHLSLLAGRLSIALDLVQTNTAAGPTGMWHGLVIPPEGDTIPGGGLALPAPGKPGAEPVPTPSSLFCSRDTPVNQILWEPPWAFIPCTWLDLRIPQSLQTSFQSD